jgi:hypothetical protein
VADAPGLGDNNLPLEFSLEQNYPNPFNPETEIGFTLPVAGEWNLTIYNVLGQTVERYDGIASQPGAYSVAWDASRSASGIYFYRIQAGENTATRKMMLLK